MARRAQVTGTIVFTLQAPWTPSRMADRLRDVHEALSFTWSGDEPADLYVEIDMTAAGAFTTVTRAVSDADPRSTCRFTDEVSDRLLSIIVNERLRTHGTSARVPVDRRVSRSSGPAPRPERHEVRSDAAAVLFATELGRRHKSERESRLRRFAASRREARRNSEYWFALSSHYGLVHGDAPSLTSLDMEPIPDAHGKTWASWVSLRLDSALGSVRGTTIRIDAPEQYDDLLRPVLQKRGAIVTTSRDRPARE